ncbi:MAG TPA: hypothetical protein PKA74_05880 [Bauldia sp.]|nr:hypothetical protein [Bauldia sp.]
MRIVGTSLVATGALCAFIASAASGIACEYQKTAAVTPAPETTATPATPVDRIKLADLEKSVIVPTTPREDDADGPTRAD